MQHPIKSLKIKNFKSIKHLEMDCSRVNILVGKPNVGKSNILEALGLFCAPYSTDTEKALSEIIRYNSIKNLFYDNNTNDAINVESNIGNARLRISEYGNPELLLGQNLNRITNILEETKDTYKIQSELFNQDKNLSLIPEYFSGFGQDGKINERPLFNKLFHSPVKKYDFDKYDESRKEAFSNVPYLLPVGGSNLFEILENISTLRKQVASYFDEYGLKLLLDFENRSLQIQKEMDGIAYKMPFNLIADTLQRIIFHYAAIASNKDSVLLFEEPENHSFPLYIRELAEKIVADKHNQYFITTHSPYLLNTIIENSEDVAVFVTGFKDYETKVKRLSKEDLSELLNYGTDLFFNLNWFEDE